MCIHCLHWGLGREGIAICGVKEKQKCKESSQCRIERLLQPEPWPVSLSCRTGCTWQLTEEAALNKHSKRGLTFPEAITARNCQTGKAHVSHEGEAECTSNNSDNSKAGAKHMSRKGRFNAPHTHRNAMQDMALTSRKRARLEGASSRYLFFPIPAAWETAVRTGGVQGWRHSCSALTLVRRRFFARDGGLWTARRMRESRGAHDYEGGNPATSQAAQPISAAEPQSLRQDGVNITRTLPKQCKRVDHDSMENIFTEEDSHVFFL